MLRRLGLMTNFAALAAAAPAASYSAEAEALFARMTTQPDATQKAKHDALIVALKTGAISGSNIWAKLDGLYLFKGTHDEQAKLLNFKGATYSLTKNGTVTASNDGMTGDGSTGYLSTGMLDNAGGVNWSRDSASMFVWINSDAGGSLNVAGSDTSGNVILLPRASGTGLAGGRAHGATSVTVAVANRLGMTAVNRVDASNHSIYRNLASATLPVASTAPSGTATLLFLRHSAAYALDGFAAAGYGGGLTADEYTDLYNALNTVVA